jgi:hypothetical protein
MQGDISEDPEAGRQAAPAAKGFETELKYALPAYRSTLAIRLLERICDPDPAFPLGIVSSIYFDSRDWAYLGEKRNSDYHKTKVRLRWYEQVGPGTGVPYPDQSFAEVKTRTGSTRVKLRLPMEYRGTELAKMELHDRELLRVPAALRAAGAPLKHALFPSFVVRYCRRRYIDRSTRSRIAIDYAISSPKVNKNLLARVFPCNLEFSVLEVKGANWETPVGLQSLFKLGFRREAFSKYYECYRHLTRTVF